MTPFVRRITRSDTASVCAVWFRSGKDEYTYLDNWQSLTKFEAADLFEKIIVHKCEIWVAEDAEIVGFLAMDNSYIDRLYVDPSEQRAGWGSSLIAKAKTLYPQGLELHTHQQNQRARNFYEKHEFQAVKFGISPAPESAPDVEYHWRPKMTPSD